MASKELENLIKETVKKAHEEGLKITELNELIVDYRQEIGYVRKKAKKGEYRQENEKDKKFKKEVYEFFLREITLEEASNEKNKKYGHIIGEEIFKKNMYFLAEIMCAAKMLSDDGKKITNKNIKDVLWSSNRYSDSSGLLTKIGFKIKDMKVIFFTKEINETWKCYYNGYYYSPTEDLIEACFKLFKDNGIE